MGQAVNWQKKAEDALDSPDTLILNPRRDDWDSSWTQEFSNEQFRQQVEWELAGLHLADLVLVVFTKDSKAPITLLEFGAHYDKAIVVVEPGYYRKGNIDVFCHMYGVPKYDTLEDGIREMRHKIQRRHQK
jgi:hypothetical protein